MSDPARCEGPRKEGPVTSNSTEDESARFGRKKNINKRRNGYFVDHLLKSVAFELSALGSVPSLAHESSETEERAHGRASCWSPEYSHQEPQAVSALSDPVSLS